MTSEEHNRTLATLYFLYGAMHGLTLFGLIVLASLVKFASTVGDSISTWWTIAAAIAFIALLFAVGLLPLLVALGFAKHRQWVKPLSIAVAIISLINIPIGTALGIYTIKFLRSEAGIKLYGGASARVNENDLQAAFGRAKPLMNLAQRMK